MLKHKPSSAASAFTNICSNTRARGFTRALAGLAAVTALAALGGCGGGNGDFEANIGGNVSGLATGQTLVLQNNGNDDTLVVTQNGKFLFSKKLLLTQSYNVTVRTPPSSQICQVSGGTGNVDSRSNDVLSVIVTCR